MRDEYRNRMDARLDGKKIPWSPPDISSRTIFLNRMYNLSKPEEIHDKLDVVEEDLPIVNDEDILKQLLDNGEVQSALFLSRRLIANGDEWAQKYYDIAMSSLS